MTYPDNITTMSGVYIMARTSSSSPYTSHIDISAGNPASLSSAVSFVAQTSWGIETISSGTIGSTTSTQERTLIQINCTADSGAYVDVGPIWWQFS